MFNRLYKKTYEAVNWRLRTFWGGKWAKYCRPGSIGMLLTKRCNARCVHCDIWRGSRAEDDAPTVAQWKQLLSDLRQWLGPVHVFITGGEALLNTHAVELLAHGSSLGLFMELLTNGYWREQSWIAEAARTRPWRVTFSMDGVGEVHNRVRGHGDFWEILLQSITTLRRLQEKERLRYAIRLKTVIMHHNLDDVANVANFAAENGLEVFYQPIEQNYDAPENPQWFRHAPTWPKDTERAVAVVRHLIRVKRQGLPICNSMSELEVMIPYFQDPDSHRLLVQLHSAHEPRLLCGALTNLQLEPNGDVRTCCRMPAVGNIKTAPIRAIWRDRPRWWEHGCCLARGCEPANT